jgi:hypothetical protein
MKKKRATEAPLSLDMDFSEALSRFVTTKPQEVDASIDRAKTKKPPQAVNLRRSRGRKPASKAK